MSQRRVFPSGDRWTFERTVPRDKSITQRALMMAAIAEGTSEIRQPLRSRDTLAVKAALIQLGAFVADTASGWRITGFGEHRTWPGPEHLNLENSGTGVRLLIGMLCGRNLQATLTGDASLRKRPMRRVLEPLQRMGAKLASDRGGTLPVQMDKVAVLSPFRGTTAVASAQVKSAILLAALRADGESIVREHRPTRNHTELLLPRFGVRLEHGGCDTRLRGPQQLTAADIEVPADPSSAAPWAALTALRCGARCRLRRVLANPRRTAFFRALEKMGAKVEWRPPGTAGDTTADLWVQGQALHGIKLDPAWVPDMIDELPLLAVCAAFARGETVVKGAAELRVKESDRIQAVVTGLRGMGVEAEEREDGFRIVGGATPRGGAVESAGDHRIAMAFAVAAAAGAGPVTIHDADCVDVSYPDFYEHLAELTAVE